MKGSELSWWDKLLEAGWLTSLIVIPLFFNIHSYSEYVFELNKAILLRSLALLIGAVWLMKVLDTAHQERSWRERLRTWWRSNPLALPALLFTLVHIGATVWSLTPWISFFGSPLRMEGLFNTLSYLVLFFVTVSSLRTEAQLQRALTVIVLVSLPVALYAMAQHFGVDPLAGVWGEAIRERIPGTMGNPIFLAAYLIFVVPLALAHGLQSWHNAQKGAKGFAVGAVIVLTIVGVWHFEAFGLLAVLLLVGAFWIATRWQALLLELVPLVGIAIIFVAQLLAICFTESRGPWLGLCGGLFAFVVLWALVRGARRMVLTLYAAAFTIMVAGVLAFLFAPAALSQIFRASPCVARFGMAHQEIEAGESLNLREQIWQGTFKLVTAPPTIVSSLGESDPLHNIRPWIGYGPETMRSIYYQVQNLKLAKTNVTYDRAHNALYDIWVATGFIGLCVYLFLLTAIFFFALKWLGVLVGSKDARIFLSIWIAGGLGVSLVLGLWRGWHLVGLALPTGMLVGFFLYVLWKAIRQPVVVRGQFSERTLGLVAVFSAVIAHLIELQFGIGVVTTHTYFWFYLALLVLLGTNRLSQSPAASTTRASPPNHWRAAFWGGISGLILITLSFIFLQPGQNPFSSFLLSYRGQSLTLTVGLLLGLSMLAVAALALGRLTVLFVSLSGAIAAVYSGIHVLILTSQAAPQSLLILYAVFLSVVLFLAMGSAFVLSREGESRFVLRHRWRSVLTIVLMTLAVGAGIATLNVATVFSSILFDHAASAYYYQDMKKCIALSQRAISLNPRAGQYFPLLSLCYREQAGQITDPLIRELRFRLSEQVLLEAQRLNPFDPNPPYRLAQLHRIWAGFLTDNSQKLAHIRRAAEYFEATIRLYPTEVVLYTDLSRLYAESGDLEREREVLERVLRVDPEYVQAHIYLAQYYKKIGELSSAVREYEIVTRLNPDEPEAQKNLVVLYLQQQNTEAADRVLRAILNNAPQNEKAVYQALHRALLYQKDYRFGEALEEARVAVGLATDSDKPLIQMYISWLQKQLGPADRSP